MQWLIAIVGCVCGLVLALVVPFQFVKAQVTELMSYKGIPVQDGWKKHVWHNPYIPLTGITIMLLGLSVILGAVSFYMTTISPSKAEYGAGLRVYGAVIGGIAVVLFKIFGWRSRLRPLDSEEKRNHYIGGALLLLIILIQLVERVILKK